jgi:Mg2+/Co2+ transporter CorC
MSREINILIDENGSIDGIFVSEDLKDAVVSIIDKCTDDPDEFDEAVKAEEDLNEEIRDNKMFCIYG